MHISSTLLHRKFKYIDIDYSLRSIISLKHLHVKVIMRYTTTTSVITLYIDLLLFGFDQGSFMYPCKQPIGQPVNSFLFSFK